MLPDNIQKGGEQALAMANSNKELFEAINMFEEAIRNKHKEQSEKKTPKPHVKKKAGLDYVEFAYMRNQANESYPLWSFTNLKLSTEFIKTGWVVVQGQLEWYENGIKRIGSCGAAHRIAFKAGTERIPENIVDLGNDIKAAVSDCMKKGFNTYMNISDDIYKKITIEEVSDEKIEELDKLVEQIKDSNAQYKMYRFVENNTYSHNYKEVKERIKNALKLQKEAEELNEEEDKSV